MSVKFTNNAETTLASGINNSVTSLTVASSSGFPTITTGEYFYVTLDDGTNNEIVKVTAVSGTTWTVVRAQDGTSARAFVTTNKVELRVTAGLITDAVSDALASSFAKNAFTGDGSETDFTLSQSPNSEDDLIVFIEGVFQNQSTYSYSGTTLTFSTAPADTRAIVVYTVKAAVSGANLNHDQFTASGSAAFTLSIAPINENNTQVFIDGVYQQKTDYAVSGTTLTFDTAPTSGAIVEVMTFTQTEVNVPAADSVTTASIADDVGLGGSPTTTTQSSSDNSTKIATTAYVTTAVSGLIDSAPNTLNTLNEIAAALNDDANFNTTVTNLIAAKMPLAGGTFTGDVTFNGTNLYFNGAASSANYNLALENSDTFTSFYASTNSSVNKGYKFYSGNQAGDLALTITDAMKIGIGTDSPATTLNVVDSAALTAQFSGYSVASAANNSRPASGSLRLGNGAGTTGLLLDYTDQGQTVAIIKNEYVASTSSEMRLQSPFLSFYTGTSAAEAMRIDSNGKVGIGVTPTHHFNLQGTGAVEARFRSSDGDMSLQISSDADETHDSELNFMSGTSGRGSIVYDHNTTAASQKMLFKTGDIGTTAMTILGDGNIGIGTTSPNRLVTLYKASAPILNIKNSDADLHLEQNGQNSYVGNSSTSGFLQLFTNNGNSIVNMLANGNVGIGETSPAAPLHVEHSSSTAYNGATELTESMIISNKHGTDDSGVNNVASLGFHVADGATSQGFINYVRTGNNVGKFTISERTAASSYSERMSIVGGNVGIGSSPDTKLHVKDAGGIELRLEADSNNSGQEDCFIRFYTDNKTQEGIVGMDNNNSSTLFSGNTENAMVFGTVSNLPTIFATNNTERLHITSGGDISIGVTKKFSFSSDEDTFISEYSANEVGISTGGSRKFALSGGNLYHTGSINSSHNFSDERLKENIVVIPNALEKVTSLRGITFTRKSDKSAGTGLIAQELEKVLPEAVYESKTIESLDDPDAEEYKGIRYETTVGLLVEAIKELETRIKTLEDA